MYDDADDDLSDSPESPVSPKSPDSPESSVKMKNSHSLLCLVFLNFPKANTVYRGPVVEIVVCAARVHI